MKLVSWFKKSPIAQTGVLLGILSACYLALFSPANRTGADDLAMLGVRSLDERQQYINFQPMTEPGATVSETINHLLRDTYLYYGYPFFATSLAVVVPLQHLGIDGGMADQPFDLWILRQMSIVWMLAAVGCLLIGLGLFHHQWLSLGLTTLLLTMPAVVENSLWWHPDALAVFLICVSLVALQQDHYRLGRWLMLAAITSGLATSTKLLGLLLAPAVVLYLLLVWKQHRFHLNRLLIAAGIFIALHVATYLVSNPFLINANDRFDYIIAQREQIERLQRGWVVSSDWLEWLNVIQTQFVDSSWIILALVGIVWAAYQAQQPRLQLFARLTLAWSIPYLVNIIWRVQIPSWKYILPALLPLLAFIPIGIQWCYQLIQSTRQRWLVTFMIVVCCLAQMIVAQRSLNSYQTALHFDQHPSIQFYQNFSTRTPTPLSGNVVVYHDWDIYLPDALAVQRKEKLGTFSSADITAWKPDYILLAQRIITLYSQPTADYVEGDMTAILTFYQQVATDSVPGYTIIYQDDFGVALVNNALLSL